jgi:hypothetical protein
LAHSVGGREPDGESSVGAWLLFWVQIGVLALCAILGASFASADAQPGDYTCGAILAVAAIVLAFVRLKKRFDGSTAVAAVWGDLLLVDDMANLVLAIVVFAVLGLAGIIVAADFAYGGLHDAGVALFIVSAIGAFLNIKHAFDSLDRSRH